MAMFTADDEIGIERQHGILIMNFGHPHNTHVGEWHWPISIFLVQLAKSGKATERVKAELGAWLELAEIGDVEYLLKELDIIERINGMIDRCIKRLLMIRGAKSLSESSSTSIPPSRGKKAAWTRRSSKRTPKNLQSCWCELGEHFFCRANDHMRMFAPIPIFSAYQLYGVHWCIDAPADCNSCELIHFIDENGGGPGVRLRKRHQKKA
jgi:hypothetical protein